MLHFGSVRVVSSKADPTITKSERLLCWTVLYPVLIGFISHPPVTCSSVVLKSPVLHDFGTWGPWDECPKGTYATGFQLKIDYPYDLDERNCTGLDRYRDRCPYNRKDQTDLNGIRLICARIGENNATQHKPTSLVGEYGVWASEFYCDVGTIIGFQLQSASFLNTNKTGINSLVLLDDNVGAINLKTFCVAQEERRFWLEGDGADFTIRRYMQPAAPPYQSLSGVRNYTKAQMCGPRQAITGIRTQVDTRKKALSNDVMGLVNIEMRCSDVVTLLTTCQVDVIYQTLLECNNIQGLTPIECKYSVTTGVETTETKTSTTSTATNIMASLGFSSEFNAVVLSGKLSISGSWAMATSSVQQGVSSESITMETTEITTLPVPANAIARVFQVVGYCGDFDVRSASILIDGRQGDLPNPIPNTGFVCATPPPGKDDKGRKNITESLPPRRPANRGRISREREL